MTPVCPECPLKCLCPAVVAHDHGGFMSLPEPVGNLIPQTVHLSCDLWKSPEKFSISDEEG